MLSFSNSEADAILKHISFNIYSGEKIALVGRAGAEKYALVSCLFRFMEPMRGSIKIDGVNIAWVRLYRHEEEKDSVLNTLRILDWCRGPQIAHHVHIQGWLAVEWHCAKQLGSFWRVR